MDKEVHISTGRVVLQGLLFDDEYKALRMTAEHTKKLTGKPSFDPYTKQKCLLLLSIKEAPFEKTLEGLGSLSRTDGLALARAYDELNEVSLGEHKASEDSSSEAK